MKQIIDTCIDDALWATTGGAVVEYEARPETATDFLPGSLKCTLPAGSTIRLNFAEPIILEGDTFSFSMFGRVPLGQADSEWGLVRFIGSSGTDEYYIKKNQRIQRQVFYRTIDDLVAIEFEAIVYFQMFLSNILCTLDEYPIDVYQALNELLSINASLYQTPCGTITVATGSKDASIASPQGVDVGSYLLFNGEKHRVSKFQINGTVKFETAPISTGAFDCFISYPIVIEPDEVETKIPSISIKDGFGPEKDLEQEFYSTIEDCVKADGTARYRSTGQSWIYNIAINGLSRTGFHLQKITEILKRTFSAGTIIYINGQRTEVHTEAIEYIDYDDATDILPKVNVSARIYVTEESWDAEVQKVGTTWTASIV